MKPEVPLIKDYVVPKYDWTKAVTKKKIDIDAVLLDIKKTKSSPKIKAPIFKVTNAGRCVTTRGVVTRGVVTRGVVTRGIMTLGVTTFGVMTRVLVWLGAV